MEITTKKNTNTENMENTLIDVIDGKGGPDSRKKLVMLYGYHNQGNFGDDIFALHILDQIKESNLLIKYYKSGNNGGPLDNTPGEKIKSPKYLKRFVWVKIFLAAKKTDKFIFCAGSLFASQSFFLIYICLFFLKLTNRKYEIYGYGVSLGPEAGLYKKILLKHILKNFNKITVRDERSKKMYPEAILKPDIALDWMSKNINLEKIKKIRLEKKRKIFGICLNETLYGDKSFYIIENIIREKYKKNWRIHIFIACCDDKEGDEHVSNLLVKKMNDVNFEIKKYEDANVENFSEKIGECEVLITARMHVGIVAAYSGVKVFQYDYADKIIPVYELMEVLRNSYTILGKNFTRNEFNQ